MTCLLHTCDTPVTHPLHTCDTPVTHLWYTRDTPVTHPWHTRDTVMTHLWHTRDTPVTQLQHKCGINVKFLCHSHDRVVTVTMLSYNFVLNSWPVSRQLWNNWLNTATYQWTFWDSLPLDILWLTYGNATFSLNFHCHWNAQDGTESIILCVTPCRIAGLLGWWGCLPIPREIFLLPQYSM